MPSGGLRPAIVLAVIALVGLGAWTAYCTVPLSLSCNVSQNIPKIVPPGLHFKLPLGVDAATIVPVKRQLKQEFGFATTGATDPYQISRDDKRETRDGDRRLERCIGGMGGSIPHLRSRQIPFRRSGTERDPP